MTANRIANLPGTGQAIADELSRLGDDIAATGSRCPANSPPAGQGTAE
ncbi:MAG: hypothetical protein H6834_16580 [Planctomycetes bacterium]|nr:hypothetical protein [Planctomycetota bacterium]